MRFYQSYFLKYKVPFLTAVLCVTLEAVCDLLGPTLMSHMINSGISKGNMQSVLRWGACMLVVTLTGACFAVIRNNLASRVSQRVGADLRRNLFEKIIHFSEVSTDRLESGSLITRMTNDTSQIIQFVNGIMRIFLKAPLTCLGSIVLASILNLRLSMIIYTVVLIVGLLIFLTMKFSYARFFRLQKAMDIVNGRVQEYLIGVRLVKAFGTYQREQEQFDETNSNLMEKGISAQMIITMISPVLTLVVGCGTAAVIFVGSRWFGAGLANTGEITAFTIYMAQILTSLIMITNIFNMFVRTKASTVRLQEVLEAEEDYARSNSKSVLSGEITFEHVTFAYPNSSSVPSLKDVSFHIHPGENLAVIGPTGSGKSTIAWLLLHFYDVTEGRILLDGRDICSFGVDELRKNIAIAPQKPMLFSGTVAENIRWGKMDAGKEEISEVLSDAQADFVLRMEDGTDSLLGSGGVNVSGGQKQRISIARSMIRRAAILILDDATSALDVLTEAKLRRRLRETHTEQTVILITQRCGTAMSADRILVMDNGACVGIGTHTELMEHCEVYQEIYQTQLASMKEVQ